MAAAKEQAGSVALAKVDQDEPAFAIVARGRTVVDHEGRKGPGEEAILSIAEIKFFTRRGFLVDPDADAVKEANGPSFERR